MRIALSEMIVEGIKTNIPLHRELMDDAQFIKGSFSIHYSSSAWPNLAEHGAEVGLRAGRHSAIRDARPGLGRSLVIGRSSSRDDLTTWIRFRARSRVKAADAIAGRPA